MITACFLKCHAQHSITPYPPSVSLLVSQHGYSDGRLPAVPPEHLWGHSLPSTNLDCGDGRHHTVHSDCPHVLLMC